MIDLPADSRLSRRPAPTTALRLVLCGLLLVVLHGPSAGQTQHRGQPEVEETEQAAVASQSLPGAKLASEKMDDEKVDAPSERHQRWLVEVEPLITAPERRLFATLKKGYQRDAFIHQFWKVRDPYPKTSRNELKERWPIRVAEARSKYGTLTDDRARIYMVHGPPDGGFEVTCTKKWKPAAVWIYQGSDLVDQPIVMIFIQARSSLEARVWNPATGAFSVQQTLGRARACINGSRLQQVVSLLNSNFDNYVATLRRYLVKPRPRSQEWVDTFVAFSTDMPPGAEPLGGTLDFAFPGRNQTRTVVHGLLSVPIENAAVGEYAGYRSHDFLLTGEVIRGDTLFENFRYKFGFPEQPAPGSIPLAFQRFLRPGSYRLIVKLEDLNSNRVLREERALDIPAIDEVYELPIFTDPRTEQLFAEATEAIEAGETALRLIPPQGALQTGFVRFDTLVSGSEIEKIRFYLDDKFMLTKNRPPYNVEIDLGSYPDLHTLRADGFDAEGAEVASDELLINTGGYRFDVNLVEPRKGKRYAQSLRARAEVEVPEGRSLEKMELYLNETLVATLYQEPYVHPITLPENETVAYVRAVAYLPDGNSTEDLVFINAPEYLEELEIQFVELYTTVLDGQGRPVDGLTKEQFTVEEDGVRQAVARFEKVQNLPIHVGILIDNSASMVGTLGEVRKAALSFFDQAITPKDRAAVITFNSFPDLAVELTNDKSALGSGLAGLVPEGQTALYDSVMFSLYYFTGIKGQRAILVLSDGRDESSRFEFSETLEYARRAGITVYSIGFRLNDHSARRRLTQLADETGGRSFYIHDIEELEQIYEVIQRELRSQYLIAYQSSNTEDDGEFRAVDLKIDRKDLTVKTLSGYYP
ncbi:MAG: VWA domain-containing protein [bacterium]|nr:VWA domain-containing protein [bacterium]